MKKELIFLFFLMIISISFHCSATSYAMPQAHNVYSPNKAFFLIVNPKNNTHTIRSAKNSEKILWHFKKEVWHYPFLVSNNGNTVATIAWKHVGEDNLDSTGVQIWNKNGVIKSIKIKDLCPNPPQTEKLDVIGPIGEAWRTWYYEVRSNGETFTIKTTRMDKFEISLVDGKVLSKTKVRSLKREEEATLGILNIIGLTSIPFLIYLVLYLTYRIFKKDRKRRKRKIKS